MQVNSLDTNIWTGFNKFSLCWMLDGSRGQTIQGEPRLLALGGIGGHTRNKLAIYQPCGD